MSKRKVDNDVFKEKWDPGFDYYRDEVKNSSYPDKKFQYKRDEREDLMDEVFTSATPEVDSKWEKEWDDNFEKAVEVLAVAVNNFGKMISCPYDIREVKDSWDEIQKAVLIAFNSERDRKQKEVALGERKEVLDILLNDVNQDVSGYLPFDKVMQKMIERFKEITEKGKDKA
jgi:hypothetical protein